MKRIFESGQICVSLILLNFITAVTGKGGVATLPRYNKKKKQNPFTDSASLTITNHGE